MRKPRVILFGDSISKRIIGQRLLRNAEITNHSKSGRKIEQVHDDIKKTDLSNANSLITHVGTNNLENDTVEQIEEKFLHLFKEI